MLKTISDRECYDFVLHIRKNVSDLKRSRVPMNALLHFCFLLLGTPCLALALMYNVHTIVILAKIGKFFRPVGAIMYVINMFHQEK